jgi:FkbM family methyltransferase
MTILRKIKRRLFRAKRAMTGCLQLLPVVSTSSKFAVALFSVLFAVQRVAGVNPMLPFGITLRLRGFSRQATYEVRSFYDLVIINELFVKQEYDRDFNPTPEVIVDLGSNSGASIIFFKLKYPDAQVYGFEPDPHMFTALQKNVRQFGDTVHVANTLVMDTPGRQEFFSNPKGISSSIVERSEQSTQVMVAAVTLDNILKDIPSDRYILVKFDVEGAEDKVFKASTQLHRVDHFIGEFHGDLMPGVSEEQFSSYFTAHQIHHEPIAKDRSVMWGSRAK